MLLLPGDIFVSRAPDPVLQQVEDFQDGTVSANDCFRPVSRYFDRIVHPAQLLTALPRAMRALTDPALCGPVTLALPQDVQAMAYDFPGGLLRAGAVRFEGRRRSRRDRGCGVTRAAKPKRPLIVAGGGVLYAHATDALRTFVEHHGIPVAETQAGKGALAWDHPLQRGRSASPVRQRPMRSRRSRRVLGIGTRLQDFTTGSHSMFARCAPAEHQREPLRCTEVARRCLCADARSALACVVERLAGLVADAAWTSRAEETANGWRDDISRITGQRDVGGRMKET